jgi:hypothetical protein
MDKNDFEFLKFRTELIELLEKYKYEISGTGWEDDSSIEISNSRKGILYTISDSCDNYQIYNESFLEEYILSCFEENKEISFHNSKIGVFTHDRDKVEKLFTNIYHDKRQEIDYYRNSRELQEIGLLDGTLYKWIKPNDGSRGHKCGKAYIDKNLTLNELNYIVVPICVYCSRENIIVF